MRAYFGSTMMVLALAGGCDGGAEAPADGMADSAAPDSAVNDDTSAAETSAPVPDTVPAEEVVDDDVLAPPTQGFQILTPPITVPSGAEETYCYYFSVPIDEAVGVKRWASQMTPGSHHLILYFTSEAQEPDGTIVEDCDGFGSSIQNVPVWTYSAQTQRAEMVMPAGVGMRVEGRQHGFVQMHYLNPTPAPLEVSVAINGETFAAGESFQQAAAFVTFNTEIEIPAGVGETAFAEGNCRVRDGIQFFALSTHAHKRAVKTEVKDGAEVLFTSDDWEHPGGKRWDPAYVFGGNLHYRCDYVNDRDEVITAGNSADRDEMCMAVGYFYPAQRPVFCINSFVVSQ